MTKTRITSLYQSFKKNYGEVFEDIFPENWYPNFISGQYGEYAPGIEKMLEEGMQSGYVIFEEWGDRKLKMWKLTTAGKTHTESDLMFHLSPLQKECLYQFNELSKS